MRMTYGRAAVTITQTILGSFLVWWLIPGVIGSIVQVFGFSVLALLFTTGKIMVGESCELKTTEDPELVELREQAMKELDEIDRLHGVPVPEPEPCDKTPRRSSYARNIEFPVPSPEAFLKVVQKEIKCTGTLSQANLDRLNSLKGLNWTVSMDDRQSRVHFDYKCEHQSWISINELGAFTRHEICDACGERRVSPIPGSIRARWNPQLVATFGIPPAIMGSPHPQMARNENLDYLHRLARFTDNTGPR